MAASADLLLDLIDIFPDVEKSLGDKGKAFRDELLALAGELDRDVDVSELGKRIESLARRLLAEVSGATEKKLRAAMGGVAPSPKAAEGATSRTLSDDPLSGLEGDSGTGRDIGVKRGRGSRGGSGMGSGSGALDSGGRGAGSGASRPSPKKSSPQKSSVARKPAAAAPAPPNTKGELPAGVVEVPVFYGTERKPTGSARPADFYGGDRSQEVRYGIARVTVPVEGRDVGDLPEPTWWKLEFKADPAKHVILASIEAQEQAQFVAALRASLASADQQDALLFVHGYNVTFTNAARRAAQISVDLKFPGRTLLYSWASVGKGDPRSYVVDEGTIQEISTRRLRAFLELALTKSGAKNVHVIAHSMGNRALMNALEDLDTKGLPRGSAKLAQVIFAAPDVAKDAFKDLAAAFKGRAQRCTLYASSRDVALKASKLVNRYARAGDAGGDLSIVEGVDTIDASNADTSLIGLRHSYFGNKRSILRDIFDVITGRALDQRFELKAAPGAPTSHWIYRE